MPQWIRRLFIEFFPRLLFINRRVMHEHDKPGGCNEAKVISPSIIEFAYFRDHLHRLQPCMFQKHDTPLNASTILEGNLPVATATTTTATRIFASPFNDDQQLASPVSRLKRQACHNVCYIAQQLNQLRIEENVCIPDPIIYRVS